MTDPVYEKLRRALQLRGGSLPALNCPEFFVLAEYLFSPEEAQLASELPLESIPISGISDKHGKSEEELTQIFERMCDNCVCFSVDRNNVRHYNLMGLLPGIFDTQFLRGQTDERAYRTAHLFKDYYRAVEQLLIKTDLKAIPFPMARVITVEQEIPPGFEIHPYDKVSEYIENNELIAMSWCYCRHYAKLLGDPCSKPAEGCIAFGRDAKYLLDRKFGWAVTKEEARSFLRRAEEAGLVHCSSNTTKYLTFFCNCCICHCSILKSFKKYGKQGSAAVSGFITEFDPEKCNSCGACVEKCIVESLIMKGEDLVYKDDLCIGCGLCSSVCPTGALKLIIRKDAPVPPRDPRELYSKLNSTEQVASYYKS